MFGPEPYAWPCAHRARVRERLSLIPAPKHRCYMLGKANPQAVETFYQATCLVVFRPRPVASELQAARRTHHKEFDNRFLDI